MYLRYAAALFLLGGHTCGAYQSSQKPLQKSSNPASPYDEGFDEFVRLTLEAFNVPGLSIAVIDGQTISSKGYGYARLDPPQNATADTQYFTGSTTKAFTAAAAALLVHDDDHHPDVKWTSHISNFIPDDFALEDEHATHHTTIEDALSHRTGLPRHDLMYGQPGDNVSSIIRRVHHLKMTAEPRTLWQYCNIMFGVMTDLLQTVTGKPLEAILKKSFWEPVGMTSTTFTLPDFADDNSRLARGYYWDPSGFEDASFPGFGRYVADPYLDLMPISGAGATISTVNDYALWIRAWITASYDGNTSSPITHRMYRDLVSPRSIVLRYDELDDLGAGWSSYVNPPTYALGWATSTFQGVPIFAHGGGLKGFGTEVFVLPNRRYGVVTMGNTQGTSNAAGEVIATVLLLRALGYDVTNSQTSGLLPRLERESARQFAPTTQSWVRPNAEAVPPPLPMDAFAGRYSHPAYGPFNLTVQSAPHAGGEILEGLFYPRTWPMKVQLRHVTGTMFAVNYFEPHGLGDILTGKGIVWEDLDQETDAVFELTSDHKSVHSLGIVLDGEMADMAERMGPDHWKEALLWFDKG